RHSWTRGASLADRARSHSLSFTLSAESGSAEYQGRSWWVTSTLATVARAAPSSPESAIRFSHDGPRRQHGKSQLESTTGAVVVGASRLLPPVSSGGVAIKAP